MKEKIMMPEEIPKAVIPIPKETRVEDKPREEVKEKEEPVKKKKNLNWFKKSFKEKNFKKPGKIAVIYLKENGNAEAIEIETRDGFFNINGKTYHERSDCIWTISKDRIPLALIPEKSMIPLGTERWEEKEMQEKFSELQDHLLKGIRHAELVKMGFSDNKQVSIKKAILYGILGLVAIVIITNFI